MHLIFTKLPGKYDRVEFFRDGARIRSIDNPKQGIIPHDMVHCAVERTLRRRGFVSGAFAEGTQGPRPVPTAGSATMSIEAAETDGVERLVEVLQADAWSGGTSDAAALLDLYRVTCEARSCLALSVDARDIDAVRTHIRELGDQWQALDTGGSMRVSFED